MNTSHPEKITIQTPLKKDRFSLDVANFIYAQAEGNYLNIHFLNYSQPEKRMIRYSLTKFKKQLADYPFIMKCHRAYLVNVNHIKKFEGNALGFKITLINSPDQVPLSRGKISQFKSLIERLRS